MDTKSVESSAVGLGSSVIEQRLPYCIATAGMSSEDRILAQKLGEHLYRNLTRDPQQPLTFGAGVPIAIDLIEDWQLASNVLHGLAENLLLIVVAGTEPLLIDASNAIKNLRALSPSRETPTRIVKLLAPSDARWSREPLGPLDSFKVTSSVLSEESLDELLDEVLVFARIQLEGLLSKSDPSSVLEPHLLLSEHLYRSVYQRQLGQSWVRGETNEHSPHYFKTVQMSCEQTWKSVTNDQHLAAVLFTDIQGLDDITQFNRRQSIVALQRGWPHLQVASTSNITISQLMRKAAIEHAKQLHFLVVADRVIERANLPVNTSRISRQPELLDFTSGMLRDIESRIVLHPDPVLTPEHREALTAVAPRVSLLTPSTLVGRYSNRERYLTSPLDGIRVGISASDISSKEATKGWTDWHLEDALVQILRNILNGGGSLSYGGDFSFRPKVSFTPLIASLTEAYRQTKERSVGSKDSIAPTEAERSISQRLDIFQPADGKLSDIPKDVVCRVRHLGLSKELVEHAIFSTEEIAANLPQGMKYSAMRKVMTNFCRGRVVLGGKSIPRSANEDGYGGRFPGIAEEVFYAIEADQPVYLCGGFGGITQRLSRLLEDPSDIDTFWDDTLHQSNQRFTDIKYQVDSHPKRLELGLPENLSELAHKIANLSISFGKDDRSWLGFNGLTYAENKTLWHSTDSILLSALIARGLIQWRASQEQIEGRLRIEAIQADITKISGIDVLALPVFDDVAPQGAGAAIDRVTDGLFSQIQRTPGQLIGVRNKSLDIDYLYALSLGKLEAMDVDSDADRLLQSKAEEITRVCNAEGFEYLGVVTIAGSLKNMNKRAVQAMLRGFRNAKPKFIIKWIEFQEDRYNSLVSALQADSLVELTTVVSAHSELARSIQTFPWLHLSVNLDEKAKRLEVSCLPQDTGGILWERDSKLSAEDASDLADMANGEGSTGKETPELDTLEQRGKRLAEILFKDQLDTLREEFSNKEIPLAITHNAAASKIPFELLRVLDSSSPLEKSAPTLNGGVHRWLKASGTRLMAASTRPRLTKVLRVGLVINPSGDLAGAQAEGEAIELALQSFSQSIRVTALGGKNPTATKERVLAMLTQVDVLHYCGHANFNENNREKSYLVLAEKAKLTAGELQRLSIVPRVVIFNACEAGRVRRLRIAPSESHDSFSLAEVFLRIGVEAFVGTYWEVNDQSASLFAKTLYQELSSGQTLRNSVTEARRKLARQNDKDWANYILYGDGRFRLV